MNQVMAAIFDPRNPTGLPDNRILRSSFLETILLKDKYRSALTRLGVRIIGARFTETVNLQNAALKHDLSLDWSLLENGADLSTTETSRRISFASSKILGTFNAAGAQINKDLRMAGAEFTGSINLVNAHIGGNLDLYGSTVTGILHMYGIRVDKNLFMRHAKFTDIELPGAHVGGQLDLNSSTVTGMLDMNSIDVNQHLFMHEKAKFKDIDLVTAHIGGSLDLIGSTVTGMLAMSFIDVNQLLFMRAQFKDIYLIAAHIGGNLDLHGSTVTGMLNMNEIRVDKSLFMRHEAKFKDINLIAANIGIVLDLNGSTVTGMLNMYGIRVDLNLLMHDKAKFTEINLSGAHIGGNLEPRSATVTGMLKMNGIRINRNLLMHEKAQFNEIDLSGAHIGGQLDLSSSTVTGKLEGKYIDVEQTVYFGNDATFMDGVELTSAKLGQDLYMSGGTFNNYVDLTGAQIGGVLSLKSTKWLGSATLNLTGAAVGAIDLSHSWPYNTYVTGLTYRNLSNLSTNFRREQAEDWFGKQAYTPQPYEQLASVLHTNGFIEDATAIRYASKERERKTASGLRWAWLFLLNYSIGFGYHLEFAFYWAVGLVLLGWAVLYATGQRTKHGITLGLTYSFDMLLPLARLRQKHYDIDLDPWARRYFFAHKIVGVILSSFIVAGITGLTK